MIVLNNSINNLIKKELSPYKLLEFMKSFKYGWLDFNNKVNTEFNEKFVKEYRLIKPKDVLKYKIGICQDQALFEYFILKDRFECKLIFIHQFFYSTHTFLIFKENNKWFYFENSFEKYRGIYGPYEPNEIKVIVDKVYKQMVEKEGDDKGFLFNEIDPEYLLNKNDIDIEEYLTICGYNFKKNKSTYEKYDPPLNLETLKKHFPELLKDKIHYWRAKTGIELIHKEPSKEELERIWKNWSLMSDKQKEISDKKSIKLFGINNKENYEKLIKE